MKAKVKVARKKIGVVVDFLTTFGVPQGPTTTMSRPAARTAKPKAKAMSHNKVRAADQRAAAKKAKVNSLNMHLPFSAHYITVKPVC